MRCEKPLPRSTPENDSCRETLTHACCACIFVYNTPTMTKENIRQRLYAWDGIHVEEMVDLYNEYAHDERLWDVLVELLQSESVLHKATTWLVKHRYGKKGHIPKHCIDAVLATYPAFEQWEAQLHVLQLIPVVALGKEQAICIEPSIRKALSSEKKFVKAAAYQAYFEVVQHVPELRDGFEALCAYTMEHESASVVSKVKKLIKALQKTKKP